MLRRLLGFESRRALPSEATFSRAFAEFAHTGLLGKAHEALIRQHLGSVVIGHIARDATAIHAGERAQYSVAETTALNASRAKKADKTPKQAKQFNKRGRPAAGLAKKAPAKPRSRIPAQLLQTPSQPPSCLSCAVQGEKAQRPG